MDVGAVVCVDLARALYVDAPRPRPQDPAPGRVWVPGTVTAVRDDGWVVVRLHGPSSTEDFERYVAPPDGIRPLGPDGRC